MLWHPIQRHGCAAAGILFCKFTSYLRSPRCPFGGFSRPSPRIGRYDRWCRRSSALSGGSTHRSARCFGSWLWSRSWSTPASPTSSVRRSATSTLRVCSCCDCLLCPARRCGDGSPQRQQGGSGWIALACAPLGMVAFLTHVGYSASIRVGDMQQSDVSNVKYEDTRGR